MHGIQTIYSLKMTLKVRITFADIQFIVQINSVDKVENMCMPQSTEHQSCILSAVFIKSWHGPRLTDQPIWTCILMYKSARCAADTNSLIHEFAAWCCRITLYLHESPGVFGTAAAACA